MEKKKNNKYTYCWVIWTNYGYGWCDESVYPKGEYTYKDVLHDAKEYRFAGAEVKIKNRRVLNEDYDPNYNYYIYYTAEELFLAFVEEYPAYVGEREFRIANSIEKRCWFADWTDGLAQSNLISRKLADSVHWEDSDNPYL